MFQPSRKNAEKLWNIKPLTLVYDEKMLAKHYWKKKRGFASADTMEEVFLCYKGNMPQGLPAERWFVHKGSNSYLQHLYHVPVCPPKELTWVDREVRHKSFEAAGCRGREAKA